MNAGAVEEEKKKRFSPGHVKRDSLLGRGQWEPDSHELKDQKIRARGSPWAVREDRKAEKKIQSLTRGGQVVVIGRSREVLGAVN